MRLYGVYMCTYVRVRVDTLAKREGNGREGEWRGRYCTMRPVESRGGLLLRDFKGGLSSPLLERFDFCSLSPSPLLPSYLFLSFYFFLFLCLSIYFLSVSLSLSLS